MVPHVEHPVFGRVFEGPQYDGPPSQDGLFVQVVENFDCCVVVLPVALVLPLGGKEYKMLILIKNNQQTQFDIFCVASIDMGGAIYPSPDSLLSKPCFLFRT